MGILTVPLFKGSDIFMSVDNVYLRFANRRRERTGKSPRRVVVM